MRVFVAVDIRDKDILQSICGLQDGLHIISRRVPAENMHFTLQFLGEVPGDGIPQVISALKTVAFAPFEMEIMGVGAFPGPESPRVIWIGTDQAGGEKMRDLARKVKNVLGPLGFRRDGAFKAHMTILRIKNKIRDITEDLNRFGGTKFGRITVSEMQLKQSRLGPSGPVYSDLEVIRAE